ncbi:hypothetical protein HII17_00940 [Thalassotalea sp. M1531]|uniref:PAS domain-containing protein n=1 Tax=Thalassotalea algicola TaxID=2716224 RepID=A0A7Y0L9K2_9GAMM|nr:hypothetical protein [Thalassotalea algicola]NMP30113.1 hypothetical protein [Thalassotalea algicola]
MELDANKLLHEYLPDKTNEQLGLSFNGGDRIIYVNDEVVNKLGYSSPDDIISLHPYMLSPEYQPDGQLSSIKALQLIEKANVTGKCDFDWSHQKLDKTIIKCHIYLFSLNDPRYSANMFAVWEFYDN